MPLPYIEIGGLVYRVCRPSGRRRSLSVPRSRRLSPTVFSEPNICVTTLRGRQSPPTTTPTLPYRCGNHQSAAALALPAPADWQGEQSAAVSSDRSSTLTGPILKCTIASLPGPAETPVTVPSGVFETNLVGFNRAAEITRLSRNTASTTAIDLFVCWSSPWPCPFSQPRADQGFLTY